MARPRQTTLLGIGSADIQPLYVFSDCQNNGGTGRPERVAQPADQERCKSLVLVEALMRPGFGGVAILGFRPRVERIGVAVRTLSECASRVWNDAVVGCGMPWHGLPRQCTLCCRSLVQERTVAQSTVSTLPASAEYRKVGEAQHFQCMFPRRVTSRGRACPRRYKMTDPFGLVSRGAN
jgi:hypothetical protein